MINAAARQQGKSYSRLMAELNKREIKLNRKVLAQLAEHHPDEFQKIVSGVSKAATSVSSRRPSRS